MNKKRIAVITCVLTLIFGALALGRRGQSQAQSQEQRDAPNLKRSEIPEQVVYKHLFHHVAALKRKAEEAESEGKDATQFRTHFKRQAELDDEQAKILDQVASDCDRDIKKLDEKAKGLIRAYLAQYPGGQVPKGELPKPPPAELRTMTEERDAIVLRARDRLKGALGDAEYKRFDDFVKKRVAPNVYQIPSKQLPPNAKNGGQ